MYHVRVGFRLFPKVLKFKSLKNDTCTIMTQSEIIYSDDVLTAKKNGWPIVALESTIITHGMPYPDNFNTALKVEETVRKQGAVPATISILDGKIHVGTSEEEIKKLSNSTSNTIKCSRRDFPLVISEKLNGGTTVSGTMLVANLAGIPIMATGGIGGVHRGAELTFDVSADLSELGRTPVAVETQGVPVVSVGTSNAFPAFYCHETKDKIISPIHVYNSKDAAELIAVQRKLQFHTGILLTVPIPKEYSLDPMELEIAIQDALEQAKCNGISGKNITPFLLQKVTELTAGESLRANKALIENNAKVAAEIAKELSIIQNLYPQAYKIASSFKATKPPVVIGGSIFDTILQVDEPKIKFDGRMYKGQSRKSYGGVARNIAVALNNLGVNGTKLLSVVGNDEPGKGIIKSLQGNEDMVQVLNTANTARYTAIINNAGECLFGIGEMDAFSAISPDIIVRHKTNLEKSGLLILDGNTSLETIRTIMDIAAQFTIPVWYEPTDVRKATKIFEATDNWRNTLHFISPNENELLAIAKHFGISDPKNKTNLDIGIIKEIGEQLVESIPVIIITLGSRGVLVARRSMGTELFYDSQRKIIESSIIQSRLYPPFIDSNVLDSPVSVSGCGDCLAAGIIAGMYQGLTEAECVKLGLKAAAISLHSIHPVPSKISTLRIS
ncbi:uncharacterized protein LOC107263278 isoform X2 [Cephus cinctus]|uniref:Uncharacterized protein LOC107263278 isoform X2 n=1 Tax=Cephus cinctus TaxID=211228 RepID=A0AAJ7BHH8_CEPCN|nr:uncharacterized protein LOC107263278 isoform X2 [Cephus cinctus]